MKKNRAVWVALIVLAVATLLMVFVVLPRINADKSVSELAGKVDDAANKVEEAATKVTDEAGKTADAAKEGLANVVLEKMGRLKADTANAADALKTLYAEGKVPDAPALAPAPAWFGGAVTAAAQTPARVGADAALGGIVAGVAEEAGKALAALGSLPADAAGASAAIDDLKARVTGAITAVEKAVSGEASPAAEVAPDAATEAGANAAVLPSFDILRVEKDGSTVIAGRAAPDSKIDIVDGDKTITSTDVNAAGEFAAVLDTPLGPGDHQITLKAMGKDGKATVSEEVATVSVPKDISGELLAMVTKPGEASRIITAPGAAGTTEAATKAARTEAKPAATATTDAATEGKPADVAIALPDMPSASADLAKSAPVIAPETASPVKEVAGQPEVVVSAVEIEGDKIFVAGGTKAGARVRVYADDKLVGESKADENGRFVVDNRLPLAVGSHTIRADVLSADGSRVEFRASVPFDRPEGEQLAVVADPSANAPANAAMVPIDAAKLTKAKEDAAKALGLLNSLFADGKVPTAEELAAARSASEIALKTLAETKHAEGDAALADSAAKAMAALKALPADPESVRAGLEQFNPLVASLTATAKPADVSAQATVQGTTGGDQSGTGTDKTVAAAEQGKQQTGDKVAADQPATEQSQASDQQKAGQQTAGSTGETAAVANDSNGVKVIEQAPLKESKSSVIIRRGDTLWQISRRVYGRGVRYTTIYFANQDQIADPDRIMPGQIFGVPEKPLENSEELHKKQLESHRK
jgi:nucleoid-associated protein YgaU